MFLLFQRLTCYYENNNYQNSTSCDAITASIHCYNKKKI